jgi:hypothetical protein
MEHTLAGGTAVAWKRTGHSPAARDRRFCDARKLAGFTVRWPISKTRAEFTGGLDRGENGHGLIGGRS